MKIPFSQLHFKNKDTNIWGVDMRRDIERKKEKDYLIHAPKNESGFVSRFIDLKGINKIESPSSLEILPYVTTRADYTHPQAGNPFKGTSEIFLELARILKWELVLIYFKCKCKS